MKSGVRSDLPWPLRRLRGTGWRGRLLVSLVWWLLLAWPLLLVRTPVVINLLFTSLLFPLVLTPVEERRLIRETSWDRARRAELIGAARRGTPPADPADRARLRDLVAKEVRQNRGAPWVGLAVALFGVLLLIRHDRISPLWLGLGLGWYVLLGAAVGWLLVRLQADRRRVLGLLGPGSPGMEAGSEGG